jgi:translation initiation factor 1A
MVTGPISLRDFQDEKCDVVLRFFPDEVEELKKLKEIP